MSAPNAFRYTGVRQTGVQLTLDGKFSCESMLNDIPVMRPVMPAFEAALPRLNSIRERGIFSNFGPEVLELEARLARSLGVDSNQVVSMSNATIGIAGCVALFPEIEKWAIPSWTFSATAGAVLAGGSTFELLDVDRGSHWIKLNQLDSFEDAVIAVAPFGAPPTLPFTARPGPTIIDAAASLGTVMSTKMKLFPNTFVVFSLHATKVLGVGEAAFVVCGSAAAAAELRSWANFGFSGERTSVRPGINGKISEITAAVAHTVLDQWEEEKQEWLLARALARDTSEALQLKIFDIPGDFVSPYWIVEFADVESREIAEKSLSLGRIGFRQWWSRGLHQMPAYSGSRKKVLTETEEVSSLYLGLPMFRGITVQEMERIHACLSIS